MARDLPNATTVGTPHGPIRVLRWSDGGRRRPAALLVHGTGHCAAVWSGIAAELADELDVYAIDRRGHGASLKPPDAYDFTDFVGDTLAVIDELGLEDAFGIGHSAGATDLLLAAPQRPNAFRRLLAIEPTVMDPARPDVNRVHAGPHHAALDGIIRRRDSFPSREDALARYDGRGFFVGWRPDLLAAYVRDGFADNPDGSVTLCCTPQLEWQMVSCISSAMHGDYRRGDPANPFVALTRIGCPTLVIATEHSQPIYGAMATTAGEMIPGAATLQLPGVGHAVPMVAPEQVAAIARSWWHGRGPSASPASIGVA